MAWRFRQIYRKEFSHGGKMRPEYPPSTRWKHIYWGHDRAAELVIDYKNVKTEQEAKDAFRNAPENKFRYLFDTKPAPTV